MARIKRDGTGRWFVTFSGIPPDKTRMPSGRTAGLDLGVAVTVTLDSGQMYAAPRLAVSERTRAKSLQRKLGRQQRGSRRYEETRRKLARIHARQFQRLGDWREKLTTELVDDFDVIAVEDLRVGNMTRSARGNGRAVKRAINRSICAAGWSTLVHRLEQKSLASGTKVIRVPPQNTSIRCSRCKYTDKHNRKSQAKFVCASCGFAKNADVNAAINIKAAGLAVAGRGEQRSSPISFEETPTMSNSLEATEPGWLSAGRAEAKSCPSPT